MTVHLSLGAGTYKCGVGKRWSSQVITSTTKPRKVTCRTCLQELRRNG